MDYPPAAATDDFINKMDEAFIPYARQWIDEDDISAVVHVLKSPWLTTGPQVEAFEKELADYCGARYAVVCSSGTAALHLSCLAIGLKEKQSAVTTPISFVATANCARYVGAKVLFSDIRPDTANLDPEKLKKTLASDEAKGARVVLPVHFAGQPARMEEIHESASQRGIGIIEDASHALGAR